MRTKIAMVVCISLGGCNTIPTDDATPTDATVTAVTQAVYDTLAKVAVADPPGLPDLHHAELTLNTHTKNAGQGGASIYVLNGSVSSTRSNSQQMTIVLTPPKKEGPGLAGFDAENASEQLADAIIAAATDVARVQAANPGGTELAVGKLEATIAFEVETTVGGGIELEIIGLKLGAEHTRGRSNAVTIVFGGGD